MGTQGPGVYGGTNATGVVLQAQKQLRAFHDCRMERSFRRVGHGAVETLVLHDRWAFAAPGVRVLLQDGLIVYGVDMIGQ